MIVSTRLGEWHNSLITATVFYDDVTFIVSTVQISNGTQQRCRFTVWRSEEPNQTVSLFLNAGQASSGKPAGTVLYRPEENIDGVTPAGNIEVRVEFPI